MAGEQHRHGLVADLPRVDASAFVLRGEEDAEQVVASLAGREPIRNDAPDRGVERGEARWSGRRRRGRS
jgi:hypothetical protein